MVLVLLIGRDVSNLEMIQAPVAKEDFDVISWSSMGQDYETLKMLCKVQKSDLITVGAGMPQEIRDAILDKFSKECHKFHLPEIPKFAFLRTVGPNEAPEAIKSVMATKDPVKIQELKNERLGPFGTPKFMIESVNNKFLRGEFK